MRCLLLGTWLMAGVLLPAAARSDELDFNRDVRPILSSRCFACHGFDEGARQAELRLDVADQAYADRDGTVPLKPGDPEASEVWRRIRSQDPDLVMPPPDSNLELTAAEKTTLRTWIEQGARYAAHWSFQPPVQREPPAVPESSGAVQPIDRFVAARLAGQGLRLSPEADRYTLIRRLSFDLTGLPPTSEEVQAFVDDQQPGAYERLVDRLLRSPHFGERLAIDWLDAARYADTNGFSIDGGRHMWLWRDWVIHAFNTNKPYDQFLREQLAGDLLPEATIEQRIATGFQRNNMVTHEGGTIPEENLTNYNADRVKTLGEAVLGLTLGCAQCHDHKYDPITQQDYYGLFAYFNTLGDVGLDGNAGVNPRPQLRARTVLRTGEEAELRRRIERLEARLQTPPEQALQRWEREQRQRLASRGQDLHLLPLQVLKVSTPNRGSGFEVEGERLVRVTQPGGLAAYDVLARLPEDSRPITGLRVVFHPDADLPGGGWGHGPASQAREAAKSGAAFKGSFRLTALSVSVGPVPADQVDLYRLLAADQVTANSWQDPHFPWLCLDPRNDSGWSPATSHEGPVHLTMTFDQPLDARQTPYLTAQLNFGSGDNLIASRMELFAVTGQDDGSELSPAVIAALETVDDQRTEADRQTLRGWFAAHAPQTRRLRIDLENARERLAVLTDEFPTMVMNVAERPRQTFILRRGDYSQPTVPVSMQTPASLPRLAPSGSPDAAQDRRSLAEWITMPDHPLTSRVYVNRIWQLMFGAGIVRTPADFGSQGEWPTHPELLDWLAVDFVQHGWDVRRLVKQIAMSATYRQTAVASEELLRQDPDNRLLARGPRFRLPAELIRDAALKTSGLLVPRLGGPSVNPYAPADLWREISHYGSTPATAQTFVQDHGEKLYRRSLYTYWKRTSPPPNMAAFDAPNRETCVVSRPVTNTPLQALVLLNDVQFVEAARVFAERIMQHEGDDDQRLRWAVLEALARPASEREREVLAAALQRETQRYQQDPAAARRLLSVGEAPRNRELDAERQAAWTQVALMLFNLSEFVTRN